MKKIILIFLFLLISSLSFTQNLDFQLSGNLIVNNEAGLHDIALGVLTFDYSFFTLVSSLAYTNDGKFAPAEPWTGDHYMDPGVNALSIVYDDFTFEAGRLDAESNLETPYSLYVTSSDISSNGMNFTYDGDFFFYNTRWIQLNYRSMHDYPGGIGVGTGDTGGTWRDKGSNHKTWGVKLGDFHFGLQDSSVYLDRSFDYEYFLSPLPQYLTQLFRTHEGKPWSELNNDNSILGFFIEYNPEDWYAYGQFLIDDVNASFLPNVSVENLTKMAWSLGVTWDTPYGVFGFYHAGATKYTFAATYTEPGSYSSLPYGFTYYPATEFPLNAAGDMQTLWYYDNYLGYKYGENNLAFDITYSNIFLKDKPWEFSIDGDLEWVINGSKSPANPWHQFDHWNEITPHAELLTDPVSEHILRLNIHAEKPIWKFDILLDLQIGYVWNGLVLEEIAPDEPKRFVPQAGNNFLLYNLSIGFRFNWDILKK